MWFTYRLIHFCGQKSLISQWCLYHSLPLSFWCLRMIWSMISKSTVQLGIAHIWSKNMAQIQITKTKKGSPTFSSLTTVHKWFARTRIYFSLGANSWRAQCAHHQCADIPWAKAQSVSLLACQGLNVDTVPFRSQQALLPPATWLQPSFFLGGGPSCSAPWRFHSVHFYLPEGLSGTAHLHRSPGFGQGSSQRLGEKECLLWMEKKTSLIDFPQSQLKNDVEHPFSPSSTSPIISTRNHDTHSHLQSQLSQIPQIHRVAHGVKSAPGRVLRRGAGSMERGSITLLGLVEFPKVQELRLKSVADIEDICGLITIQYPW